MYLMFNDNNLKIMGKIRLETSARSVIDDVYKIGEKVYFVPDGTNALKRGEIVAVHACVSSKYRRFLENDLFKEFNDIENQFAHYVVMVPKGNTRNDPDDSDFYICDYIDLYSTVDEYLSVHDLKQFDCDVWLSRGVSISDSVYARTKEDAFARLKEKYPEAKSVTETDPYK